MGIAIPSEEDAEAPLPFAGTDAVCADSAHCDVSRRSDMLALTTGFSDHNRGLLQNFLILPACTPLSRFHNITLKI